VTGQIRDLGTRICPDMWVTDLAGAMVNVVWWRGFGRRAPNFRACVQAWRLCSGYESPGLGDENVSGAEHHCEGNNAQYDAPKQGSALCENCCLKRGFCSSLCYTNVITILFSRATSYQAPMLSAGPMAADTIPSTGRVPEPRTS
jgi:hypothetical protein